MKGRAYFWDGAEWRLSANRVAVPEGWYILSMDMDEEAVR